MIHSTQIHGRPDPKAGQYLAGWQRARAELENFKKNMQTQQSQLAQQQLHTMLEPILSLNDNFRAMVQHVPDELKDNAWAQGVLHIARQLEAILEQYNVQTIEKSGEMFNPQMHEAIENIKAADKNSSGKVIEVIQAGYMVEGRVIRPAKVRVAN
jgi:molecular chaperone GrpE